MNLNGHKVHFDPGPPPQDWPCFGPCPWCGRFGSLRLTRGRGSIVCGDEARGYPGCGTIMPAAQWIKEAA